MGWTEWAQAEGITPPAPALAPWLREHPDVADELAAAADRGFLMEDLAVYLEAEHGMKVNPDSLRKRLGEYRRRR